MLISLIAAMSENKVIGRDNMLPWHYPEDLQYFKRMTLGKPVVMGRKTFASLNNRPLPGRQNIILSQDSRFAAPGCTVVFSEFEAIEAAKNCEELMVIGGAKIYELFLPLSRRIYLTLIHQVIEGDVYFPLVDWQKWEKVSEEDKGEFSWIIYDKII